MSHTDAIGIDVGGTSSKALLVARDGTVRVEHRLPTRSPDPTGAAVVATVVNLVEHIAAPTGTPVGVVVPGVVDERTGTVLHAVNLGWTDLPLRDLLSDALGQPVAFGHDVRSAAIAEARTGAARGVPGVVALVAVGTGVSAAVLVDGQPVAAGGWAGEIGQLVLPDGPFAGSRVEQVASATAIARRAGAPDARTVAVAVASGDSTAATVWDQAVEVLAGALAALVVTAAPATIVMGGGLALAGEVLLEPLAAALSRRVTGLRLPRLEVAAHGDRAAALGAAVLARESR